MGNVFGKGLDEKGGGVVEQDFHTKFRVNVMPLPFSPGYLTYSVIV